MPAWMVTGGSGFLGRHLLDRLGGEAAEVVAVGRRLPEGWPSDRFVAADLIDPGSLARAVAEIGPDRVFHLAGRTPPADPSSFESANAIGTARLLDALRDRGKACRLVVVGSAAELGPVPVEALPVGEDWPCRPVDAYGQSKWRSTLAALTTGPPLEVTVARVFNPIGPGLPASQALGRFAEELAEGEGPARLLVGDLDARRDFVDARDVADALVALGDRGGSGRVYHVGSGRSERVGDGLDLLIALSGRAVTVARDPAIGPNRGPADSRADVGRIAQEVGWSAAIPFEQSLADLWAWASGRSDLPITPNSAPIR